MGVEWVIGVAMHASQAHSRYVCGAAQRCNQLGEAHSVCSAASLTLRLLLCCLLRLALRIMLCRRAKYELKHVVRTHLAANDAAFNCVVEQEDKEGVRGVTLSKELMAIAGGNTGLTG